MDVNLVMVLALGILGCFMLFAFFGFGLLLFRPWLRVIMSGGKGSLIQILGMRLRGNPPSMIIDAYTSMLHSGDDVSLADVEAQYVANRAIITSAQDLIACVRTRKGGGGKDEG